MLGNPDNLRCVETIVQVATPVMTWHGQQSRQLRCAEDTEKWLLEQFQGALLGHIEEVMRSPCDVAKVRAAGLMCSKSRAEACDEGECVIEDEFASLFG
eukprot:9268619-Alexandrium_andersonii.AAC.1